MIVYIDGKGKSSLYKIKLFSICFFHLRLNNRTTMSSKRKFMSFLLEQNNNNLHDHPLNHQPHNKIKINKIRITVFLLSQCCVAQLITANKFS